MYLKIELWFILEFARNTVKALDKMILFENPLKFSKNIIFFNIKNQKTKKQVKMRSL